MNFLSHPFQAAVATLDQQTRAAMARTAVWMAHRLLTIAAWFATPLNPDYGACDAPRRIDWPAGGELEVTSGTVWVTQEGSLDDHCLTAGERLALPAGPAVWIGCGPLDTAEPAGWRWCPAAPKR
jgi:hypothetical protein